MDKGLDGGIRSLLWADRGFWALLGVLAGSYLVLILAMLGADAWWLATESDFGSISPERRGELIAYATDKYGADKVAQVITFGTIKTKAALKDSARVNYGQPGFAIADRITKALPPPIMAKDIPVSGITDPTHERYKEAAEVRALTGQASVEVGETCPGCGEVELGYLRERGLQRLT